MRSSVAAALFAILLGTACIGLVGNGVKLKPGVGMLPQATRDTPMGLVPNLGDGVRYDDVLQKGSHNSFQRSESLFDQLVYHRVRSLELDLHREDKDFKVWHECWGPFCDDDSTCDKLSDCIDVLDTFHRAVPKHEVVTIWLEPKEGFDLVASNNLDALLHRLNLFAPADLVASCPGSHTIREAARRCHFPTLEQLRGKFIAVVMNASDDPNPPARCSQEAAAVRTYASPGIVVKMGDAAPVAIALTRAAFVAPCPSEDGVDDYDYAFLNGNGLFRGKGPNAYPAYSGELITRDNADDDDYQVAYVQWEDLKKNGVNHVAADLVNYLVPPVMTTHNPFGWPFVCKSTPERPLDCSKLREHDDILHIEANTGDIDGRADDFFFAYESRAEPSWSLQAFVSSPSSHVEEWAKGCIMARQGESAGDRYFAVCRPADSHNVRIQFRAEPGGDFTVQELPINPERTAAYLQVHGQVVGGQTCFFGSASSDGVNWTPTSHGKCLGGTFPLRGLAVSSHASGNIMYLFGNVRRTVNGVVTPYSSAKSFPIRKRIPTSLPMSGSMGDGPVSCALQCAGRNCGEQDLCGNLCSGPCPSPSDRCVSGTCCTPDCSNIECGVSRNGCGLCPNQCDNADECVGGHCTKAEDNAGDDDCKPPKVQCDCAGVHCATRALCAKLCRDRDRPTGPDNR